MKWNVDVQTDHRSRERFLSVFIGRRKSTCHLQHWSLLFAIRGNLEKISLIVPGRTLHSVLTVVEYRSTFNSQSHVVYPQLIIYLLMLVDVVKLSARLSLPRTLLRWARRMLGVYYVLCQCLSHIHMSYLLHLCYLIILSVLRVTR